MGVSRSTGLSMLNSMSFSWQSLRYLGFRHLLRNMSPPPQHATATHHVPVLQLAAEVYQLDVLLIRRMHVRRLFTQHYMTPTTIQSMHRPPHRF